MNIYNGLHVYKDWPPQGGDVMTLQRGFYAWWKSYTNNFVQPGMFQQRQTKFLKKSHRNTLKSVMWLADARSILAVYFLP